MDSTLSILGSIASIAGAVWALREARKSADAATKAESLRDEIVHRRKMLEVSQVYADTKRILTIVSDIGPSSNPKRLRGINSAKIAREIEEYARLLLEQSSHFSDNFGNKARALGEDLRPDIEALAEAVTPEDKKEHGKSAYRKIEGFILIAKQHADDRREQTPKGL
jgi:hypothetical protein